MPQGDQVTTSHVRRLSIAWFIRNLGWAGWLHNNTVHAKQAGKVRCQDICTLWCQKFFTGNLEVYCGIQPNGPYNFSSGPSDIVTRLTVHMKGTCRNLTTDNWYTSYPLAVSLLKDKITLVGTLKKQKGNSLWIFAKQKQRSQFVDIWLSKASYLGVFHT